MALIIGEKELEQLPVSSDPEVVSGALVFQGTRVPVEALINNLEAGLTPDEFLDNFQPSRANRRYEYSSFEKYSADAAPRCINILLDECTPRNVKKRLPHLAIGAVQEMGWAGIKNCALLKLAEAEFEIFITISGT